MQKLIVSLSFIFLMANCIAQKNETITDSSIAVAANKIKIDDAIAVTKTELSIYPNPAKNKITLQVKGFRPGNVSVKMLDTKGKMLREDSRLLVSGNEDIIMFLMFPPGIYFIIVSQEGKISRKKLLVQ